jgi:EAL and modified HD-GYP domain-containing signal transduction protein
MDRLLLSRQPICHVDFTVFGYELLFRDSDADEAKIADGEKATAQVVVNLMEIGVKQMVGNHQAFINVSSDFLLKDFSEALPPGQIVFELLEPVEVDRALIKRIHQLTAKGYRLATGDFVFRDGFGQLLELAHIVKFDLQSNSSSLRWNAAKAARNGAKLAAERVETFEQFNLCKSYGFDYFQGYFLCRPERIQTKRLPLSRINTLRLMGKLNDPKLRIDELEAAIRQDLSLTYKLLKFVGSAACPVRTQINSIRHAAVLIGIERLKVWASLILFSGIQAEMKELSATAVIRARMCEKLAEARQLPNTDQFFLVGMFSLLDAMLNQPLLHILKSLNLAPEINDALVYHGGTLGEVLKCVKAYERRAWEDVHCGNLDSAKIREIYVKAVSWSIQTLTGFSDVISEDAAQKETRIQLWRSS